jgi:uncharacterized protein YaiI (UPF0178 family)
MRIYVDGDACPVKQEVYKVAARYKIPVTVVANSYFRLPRNVMIQQVVVDTHPDAADDYIAENCNLKSVVITADILLAGRCLDAGATVISPAGKPFTDNAIGAVIATRNLMTSLRETGIITGGPAPFSKNDRSRFLSALDEALVRLQRNCPN